MAAGDELRKQWLLRRVRRVQRRLNGEVWLAELLVPLWGAVGAVAAWRFFLRANTLLFAVPVFALAFALWLRRVRRRSVSLEQAAVLADRLAGAGGLLLTRLETPLGEWELSLNERVGALRPPEVRRGRSAAASSLAVLFLLLAMAVPLPRRAPTQVNAAAASKLAELEQHAEALAREEPLGESVEEELERLREELAEGRFDAEDWEALDGLGSSLEQRAASAAAELSRAAEAARALEEALGDAQRSGEAAREREALEEALLALGEGAGDGGQAQSSQSGSGSGERSAGQSGGQVSDLRRALEERQQRLANAFGQAQGEGGARQASRTRGTGRGRPSGGEGQGGTMRGERGGPSRGGGAGQLAFGELPELDPEKLQFAPLPEGRGGEAQELWGLRAADPKPRGGPSTGGTGTEAAGEQAPGQKDGPLLPRNRELVKRYFDAR